MINTIVRGPTSGGNDTLIHKYVVRTYLRNGTYVTSIFRLMEAANDFWWAEGKPEIAHLIKDDLKEDVMFDYDKADCTWLWNTGETPSYSDDLKELGDLHLRVCKQIIDGDYTDSQYMLP